MANITLLYANPTANTEIANPAKPDYSSNSSGCAFDSNDFNNILNNANDAISNKAVKESPNAEKEPLKAKSDDSTNTANSKNGSEITDKNTSAIEKKETTSEAEVASESKQTNNETAKTEPVEAPKKSETTSTESLTESKPLLAQIPDAIQDIKNTTTMAELNNGIMAALTPVAVETTIATITAPITGQIAEQNPATTNTTAPENTVKVAITSSNSNIQDILPQQNVEIDISNLYTASANVNSKPTDTADKIKVQPQAQQVLLNLELPNSTAQTAVEAAAQNIAQNTTTDINSQVQTQTPTIQVASDVAVKTLTSEQKQNLTNNIESMTSIHEKLTELKGKVTNVETTTSDNSGTGGNLLSQQNAQEQSIKFSVENSGFISPTSQTTQGNFENTINTVTNNQQAKDLNSTELLSQIHNKFSTIKPEETTKITLVLNPESLGKVSLELIKGKEGLTAQMTAENAQVKEILDKSLDSLKNSLTTQGVSVNNINVKIAETQEQYNGNFDFSQQQGQNGEQGQTNRQGLGQHQSSKNEGYSFEEELSGNFTQNEDSNQENIDLGIVDYKV